MAHALQTFVAARLEILVLNERAGIQKASPEFKQLENDATQAIEAMCRCTTRAPAEQVKNIMASIAESPLRAENKTFLTKALNQTLTPDLHQAKLQKMTFPQTWLTEPLWRAMQSEKIVHLRITKLAEHFVKMGLHSPTEPTSKNIAAIAMHDMQEVEWRSAAGLQYVRAFKAQVKHYLAAASCAGQIARGPDVYTSPNDLRQMAPNLYNGAFEDAPATCPPELKGPISAIQSTLGCRSTKIGYGGVRAPLAKTFDLNALLAQVCGQTPSLPGLKVFGMPQRPVLPCALQAPLSHDSPPHPDAGELGCEPGASNEPGNDALDIALLGKKPHEGLPPEAPQSGLPSSSSGAQCAWRSRM